MKLYNTYSQKQETLDLSPKIGIYVCGITPYDTTHIGHAFTFIIYDVLVRYLRFLGASVTYVQNITDIDDDILIRAKSLGISWQKLGNVETQKHLKNMDALNALRPDIFPKATDHITSMIRIIEVLLNKGFAYEKNGSVLDPQSKGRGSHGSVYFEIKKDKNFGKLSKFGYPAMLEVANDRGNFPLDVNKRDPLDFVLWQKHRKGEPFWDSPWGKGRPGWHIECNAMSMRYLGPTITLHGGGADLIFPHHEAEIAQSENATGQKFVKHWLHTAMVYCQGKKMSKSLGNMIFVADLLKIYDPNAIRLFLLSHHWRTSWDYEETQLIKSREVAKILLKAAKSTKLDNLQTKKLLPQFFRALDDNLNIPKAIEILVGLAKGNRKQAGELISKCSQILGLKF